MATKTGCDCISDIENINSYEGDEIKGVLLKEAGIVMPQKGSSTREVVLHLEFRVDGKKRPVTQSLLCDFCPFCGLRLRGE